MKEHILHLLRYNDRSNHLLLESILQLPHPAEAIKLFSHLVTSQDKWHNRVEPREDDRLHSWFGTIYPAGALKHEWERSMGAWINLITGIDEQELGRDVYFIRQSDKKRMKVKLQDIVLQVNYHSMHHRAQINRMISAQGLVPPPTDYILGTITEAD